MKILVYGLVVSNFISWMFIISLCNFTTQIDYQPVKHVEIVNLPPIEEMEVK